jgi:hypothetical protein
MASSPWAGEAARFSFLMRVRADGLLDDQHTTQREIAALEGACRHSAETMRLDSALLSFRREMPDIDLFLPPIREPRQRPCSICDRRLEAPDDDPNLWLEEIESARA